MCLRNTYNWLLLVLPTCFSSFSKLKQSDVDVVDLKFVNCAFVRNICLLSQVV